jgi:hypothetical protein
MRILHVLEPGAGEDAVIACRAACRVGGADHAVWLIGSGADERFAAEAGVRTTDRVAPPLGEAVLAARGLAALARMRGERPDMVQCYSVGALAAARLVFPRRARLGVLARRPARAAARTRRDGLVEALALGGGAAAPTVLALGRGSAEAWEAFGARDVRVCRPPALGEAGDGSGDGARVRAEILDRLGPVGGAEGWTLIALLGDAAGGADARRFAFALGLLYTTGRRVAGVVPAGAGQRRRAARFVRAHGRQWGLVEWSGPMERAAAACDVALADGSAPAAVLATLCAAQGVPVVARDDGDTMAQLLGDVGEACLAAGGGAAAAAAKLLPLVEDAALRRRVGARLRECAARAPGGESFGRTLEAIWREMIRGSAAGGGGSVAASTAPAEAAA